MDRLGSYRLRKRLAVGGMGEVYLGEKIGPEGFVKPVVLKCVLPQLASDRAFVKLFEDEARLAALLNHPNIAQVYDFGLVDNTYYLAMEYVPGYTVDDIRRKLRSIDQNLPLQHVACIASQVCQGLHYAHALTDGTGVSLGLVHRDVSPHNLIVSVDGAVKIVDFGIAKARAGLTRVQAKGAVGKFGYMSPEQARGGQVDGRSDVFSLGICLWELLTNERLHDPNMDRAPDYAPTRPVRSVEQFRSDLPRQFLQILETALAIPPEDRFQTAQDMHLALERFQAAMTHYAGQAALAAYIKDLVDGRIEHPEQQPTGELVQPAGDPLRRPVGGRAPRASMDEAQRYEEVFGVTMSSKRPRPSLRAVPKSWDIQPPPPPAGSDEAPILLGDSSGSLQPVSGSIRTTEDARAALGFTGELPPTGELAFTGELQVTGDFRTSADVGGRYSGDIDPHQRPGHGRMLDLAVDDGVPELDVVARRPVARRAPPPRPHPRSQRGGPSVSILVTVVLLAALAGSAYAFRDHLVPLVEQAIGAGPAADAAGAATMNTSYRIESVPAGAVVYLDGERQKGTTPLTVDLIPGVEYRVEVRRPGRATAQRTLTAAVHEGVAKVAFTLERAGTLRVRTVPPGASVTVDGRAASGRVTPLTLTDVPSGRPVRVRVRVKGLAAQERTITVPAGKTRTLTVEL